MKLQLDKASHQLSGPCRLCDGKAVWAQSHLIQTNTNKFVSFTKNPVMLLTVQTPNLPGPCFESKTILSELPSSFHSQIWKLCWIGHLQCKFCIFCPLAWLKFNPKPPFESSLALSLSESDDNMMWRQPRASYIWKHGRLLVISWPSTVSATPYDLFDAVTVWERHQLFKACYLVHVAVSASPYMTWFDAVSVTVCERQGRVRL